MAYVTKEKIKEKRQEIRKAFPSKKGWKISVVNEHYSTIRLAILEAPYQMLDNPERGNESVNFYYLEDHYKDNPKKRKDLKKMYEIINKGNYNNSNAMIDYFDVGFYVSMEIGKWDKPFKVSKK